jgi:hypothetical protein
MDRDVVEGPNRKSRAIGFVKDMTKSEARTLVGQIVAELEARRQQDRSWHFGEFVTEVYFPLLRPEMEGIDADNQYEPGFNSSRGGLRDA